MSGKFGTITITWMACFALLLLSSFSISQSVFIFLTRQTCYNYWNQQSKAAISIKDPLWLTNEECKDYYPRQERTQLFS